MTFKFWNPDNIDLGDRPTIIVVEGKDDAYFFDALLEINGFDESEVRILVAKSKNEIEKAIDGIRKSRSYVTGKSQKVIVFLDADEDADKTAKMVQKMFSKVGADTALHAELVITDDQNHKRAYGFYVLPDGVSSGMLEDIMIFSLREDKKFEKIKELYDQIEEIAGEELDKKSKRLISLYLAVSNFNSMGCGNAFRNGAFQDDMEVYADIVEYLSKSVGLAV